MLNDDTDSIIMKNFSYYFVFSLSLSDNNRLMLTMFLAPQIKSTNKYVLQGKP